MSTRPQSHLIGAALRLVATLVFAVVLWCAPAWGAEVSFAPQTVYPVGGYPASVEVADFNGDGDADLAVVNEGSNRVQVLLGGPGGAFGTPTGKGVGGNPERLAVGDFNGDSDPDLVVGYLNASYVSVLLGGPGGTFGAETRYSVGYNHGPVAVGDFNRDGDPDIVTANLDSRTVSVLLGGPGGTFGVETRYPVGAAADSVTVGDFNGDGDPDLAVAGESSDTVSVLLGGSGGTFGSQASYAVGSYPSSVAVSDFNGDGDPDLAVANHQSDDVSVLLGGAGGAFAAQNRYLDAGNPVSAVAGDFNGDGDPDLATANYGANSVAVLLGGPGGTFGAPNLEPVGSWPHGVAVGDFDRDGNPDLAVANTLSASVSVLVNITGVSLDPSDVAFPATVVGQGSATRKVTLTNHGQAGVAVSGVGLAGGDADSFASSEDTCSGATVPSGGSCSVKVRFRPTGVGAKTASLRFTDSAPDSPQSVALSGVGVAPPASVQVRVETPVSAGESFAVTATARDAAGHTVTAYNAPATWSDRSGQLSPTTPAKFVNGVSTTTATVPIPVHDDRITVTSGGVTGQSSQFNVRGPYATIGFRVSGPVSAGVPFTVKAIARDAVGNQLPSYNGPATWADRSGQLSPATPASFVNGVSTTTTIIAIPIHDDRITVTSGGVTGQSSQFNVFAELTSLARLGQQPLIGS